MYVPTRIRYARQVCYAVVDTERGRLLISAGSTGREPGTGFLFQFNGKSIPLETDEPLYKDADGHLLRVVDLVAIGWGATVQQKFNIPYRSVELSLDEVEIVRDAAMEAIYAFFHAYETFRDRRVEYKFKSESKEYTDTLRDMPLWPRLYLPARVEVAGKERSAVSDESRGRSLVHARQSLRSLGEPRRNGFLFRFEGLEIPLETEEPLSGPDEEGIKTRTIKLASIGHSPIAESCLGIPPLDLTPAQIETIREPAIQAIYAYFDVGRSYEREEFRFESGDIDYTDQFRAQVN